MPLPKGKTAGRENAESRMETHRNIGIQLADRRV